KQHCGLGFALMQYIENIAKEHGIDCLSVPSSVTAEGFYKKLGYMTLRDEYYGTERTIIMEKRIKAPSQTNNVEVVPYDLNWPNIFEAEAALIKKALADNCIAIHHVGSTSVPGLAAKPKIDIIAVVRNLFFDKSQLEAVGYKYRGGFNIPLRRSFTIRTVDRNINLHIFEENDPEIELNILFRDHLRENPSARDEYALLKHKLIAEESSHQKNDSIYRGYTLGKHDFIQNILQKSGFKKHRFVLCTHHSEWAAAKHFRDTYFFGPHGIEDPYTWTFNHEEHAHLVLYQGTEIVAYAHIQFWPDQRAAIRIIAVDEYKRNQNSGSVFLALIEKWLKSFGVKSIHAESRQSSLRFYLKNGYTNMPFDDPENHESDPNDVPVGKLL
ncbi:MAG: GNAT family N-acetyltransferase, partial [Gammaproteobacteria bacterium]|nr:GNAT family N-acetyltransferase [Gammaproteobacteria bacterium]